LSDDVKDGGSSLRAELAALTLADDDPRAVVYNDHDRQRLAQRAIARRKKAGKKIGGDVPYGYEIGPDGETLRASLSEQRVILAARKLRSAGLSLREVGRRLQKRGMSPREGDTFHASQIKRMTDTGEER
jgi:hypothetical protein